MKKSKTITKAVKFSLRPITDAKRIRLLAMAENFCAIYAAAAEMLPSITNTSHYGSRKVLNRLRKDIAPMTTVAAQIAQEAIEYARANYETMQTQKEKVRKTITSLESSLEKLDETIQNQGKRARVRKKLERKIRKARRGLRTPYPVLTKNIIRMHNQAWGFEKKNDTYYLSIPAEKVGARYKRIWLPLKPSQKYADMIDNTDKWGVGQLDIDTDTFITTITVPNDFVYYEPETYIGVDMGINNLAVIAVCDSNGVQKVKLWSGKETRHIRNRFVEYHRMLSKVNRVDLLKKNRGREHRWMQYTNHVLSRQIVDIAKQYHLPMIVMEDLHNFTTIRWNFYQLRQMIEYKANYAGVRTIAIHPTFTSQICNRCGCKDKNNRHGTDFACVECGYRVNADVNAAINIARRGEWVIHHSKKTSPRKL